MEKEELDKRLTRMENKIDLVLKMRNEFELMKKIFAGLWIGLITWIGLRK